MEMARVGAPAVAVAQNTASAAYMCFVGQAGPAGLIMCLGGGQRAEHNNVVTTFRSFEKLGRCCLHRVIGDVARGRRPVNDAGFCPRSLRERSGP